MVFSQKQAINPKKMVEVTYDAGSPADLDRLFIAEVVVLEGRMKRCLSRYVIT
jgi:hypothetical protein